MRRSLATFSESEASNHTPSLAAFTTSTPELKFSVHTRQKATAPQCAGDRAGQQTGPDRLERSCAWTLLRSEQTRRGRHSIRLIVGSIARTSDNAVQDPLPAKVCERIKKRWRTGLPGACEHW